MNHLVFPRIQSAGLFDTREAFVSLTETKERPVLRYEIEFFAEPGGTLFVDGRRYEIRTGAVLVAKPGQTRHSILPFRTYFVKIENAEGEILYMLDRLAEFGFVLNVDKYVSLVKEIALYYQSEKCAERLRAYSSLFSLLSMLYEEGRNENERYEGLSERHKRAVVDAAAYMNLHYRENCSLEDIAAAVNFSPIYFNRLFLSATGETPYAYLTRRRMEEARRRLITSDDLLLEISEKCGFSSPSYFASVFRRTYGISPRKFRETERTKYWE